MKILIVPQRQFDETMKKHNLNDGNIEEKTKLALISVVETFEQGYQHWFKEDHVNVLNFDFDDIEKAELETATYTAKGFSFEQGKKLIKFLESIDKEKCNLLIVHCAAGISRSGAIGTYANEFLQLDNKEFLNNNKYIHPNGRTLRILHRLDRGIEIDE